MKKIKTILVVDDDADARWGLAFFLKKEGFTVYEAGDGVEALNLLEKEKVNLILSDLKMPNFDGLDLLKLCKKKFQNVFFVMMTAYGDCESFCEILDCGAFEYLNKPVKLNDILRLIEKIEGGNP